MANKLGFSAIHIDRCFVTSRSFYLYIVFKQACLSYFYDFVIIVLFSSVSRYFNRNTVVPEFFVHGVPEDLRENLHPNHHQV